MEFCSSRLQWGTVCNTQWTQTNSDIVCHSLGYSDLGEACMLHTIFHTISFIYTILRLAGHHTVA